MIPRRHRNGIGNGIGSDRGQNLNDFDVPHSNSLAPVRRGEGWGEGQP